MPTNVSIQNKFIGGLKTEFTGLDFPENSFTDGDNTVVTIIGNTVRRLGFDKEANAGFHVISDSNQKAISTFVWENAGGDGNSRIVVQQIGSTLYFYLASSATLAVPLSSQLIGTVGMVSTGADNTITECQYASGNGYLFVYSPYQEPFYVTFDPATNNLTSSTISINIRDFAGIVEPGVSDNFRPVTLTAEHNYNIDNQGWSSQPSWTATSSTSNDTNTGSHTWTIQTGLTISNGQLVLVHSTQHGLATTETGTVTSYNSGTGSITINITSTSLSGVVSNSWTFTSQNTGKITTWFSAEGNYPSNADVWWQFKDNTNVFNPATTAPNITLNSGPAPKGFYILPAFNQDRSSASGIAGLTSVTTLIRPKTGTWFQGRVWYAGIDAAFPATGDAQFYNWSESIYFSQIIQTINDFGKCYQTNDPTSENLFDLLPTDGGSIFIQGCGSIYKLFPVQNGLLVFASQGIWFITGSQGIGFSATDYTITKISNIRSISGTSHVNVLGWPVFWNEEGIYQVAPSQQGGGLQVNNLCIGTILSFYADIPLKSKMFARGDYDPVNFILQWIYKNTDETTNISTRYRFDRMLNFNTSNHAFYTYTVSQVDPDSGPWISGMNYVINQGGLTQPESMFKYITQIGGIANPNHSWIFSEENDPTYTDWISQGGVDFDSFFITGYAVHGQAFRKVNPVYVYMFSDNTVSTAYKIQGIFDYANDGNSGRYSSVQSINNSKRNFGLLIRRHRIRGRGIALQYKLQSVTGQPFNFIGWAVFEQAEQGV